MGLVKFASLYFYQEMISIPRVARKDLNTLFLNIIVQGVNKEYIFYSEKYIKIINDNIKDYKITIIAYCIMNNHAYFLLNYV